MIQESWYTVEAFQQTVSLLEQSDVKKMGTASRKLMEKIDVTHFVADLLEKNNGRAV